MIAPNNETTTTQLANMGLTCARSNYKLIAELIHTVLSRASAHEVHQNDCYYIHMYVT